MPGPPFVFGAMLVILAILVAAFIPENSTSLGSGFRTETDEERRRKAVEDKRRSSDRHDDGGDAEYKVPLMQDSDEEVDLL